MTRAAPLLPIALLGLLPTVAGCLSLPDQYCQAAGDCDSLFDPVGESDDSVAVCAVQQQTALDVYRANSEDDCHEVAEKQELYMACVVEEHAEDGCEVFELGNGACSDEFFDWAEAAADAGGRCND